MERTQYKATNGGSRRATPDAPERIGHPRRCTGHGRRTPDDGSARERVPTAPHRAETRRDMQRPATPDTPDRAEYFPAAHITIINAPPIFRLKAQLYHPPSSANANNALRASPTG